MKLICWKFVLFGLFVFGPPVILNAQNWNPVPVSDSWRVYDITAASNPIVLDAGDTDDVDLGQQLRIRGFSSNGFISFVTYKNLDSLLGQDSIFGRKIFRADSIVYVVYSVYNNGNETIGMSRYHINTGQWVAMPRFGGSGDANYYISDIELYKNHLYFAGYFSNIGINGVLSYDLIADSTSRLFNINGDSVRDLAVYNNLLYIGGSFDSTYYGFNLYPGKNLAIFNDSIIYPFIAPVDDILFVKNLNSSLVYYERSSSGNHKLSERNGSGVNVLDDALPEAFELTDATFFNGTYYFIHPTKGNVTLPAGVLTLSSSAGWNSIPSDIDLKNSAIVSSFANVFLQELGDKKAYPKTYAQNSSFISGRVFYDVYDSCYYSGELLIPGVLVSDSASGSYTMTDENGYYMLEVLPGNYSLSAFSGRSKILESTVCSIHKNINVVMNDTSQADIPIKLTDTIGYWDLALIAHVGSRARQGFTENYTLKVTNEDYKTNICKVELRTPVQMQWISNDVPMYDSTLHVYRWELNLGAFKSKEIHFKTKVGVTSPAQEVIKISVKTETGCLDSVTSDSVLLTVVGAFDPNDKICYPSGNLELGMKSLKYHVNFQNTGTDTAYRVTIIDTIDKLLPLRYLKILGASHSYKVKIENDPLTYTNTLVFVFDDILLPDSTRNLEGSQGFVEYMVSLTPSIKVGDSIMNTAHIFFDYQKAIVTNTVISKMAKKTSVKLPGISDYDILLYPNPSQGSFSLRNNFAQDFELDIYDVSGKKIQHITLGALSESSYTLADLNQGIYFIRNSEGTVNKILIMMP